MRWPGTPHQQLRSFEASLSLAALNAHKMPGMPDTAVGDRRRDACLEAVNNQLAVDFNGSILMHGAIGSV